ncbi:MAG: hypothetical protein IBV53_05305 [Candidatus Atribacteria bacterium]
MTKRMVFNFYFSSSNVGQASRLSTLTGRIQRTQRPHQIERTSQPRMEGMDRTRHNNYH